MGASAMPVVPPPMTPFTPATPEERIQPVSVRKKGYHILSLVLSMLLWGMVTVSAWCGGDTAPDNVPWWQHDRTYCGTSLLFLPLMFLGFVYVGYLIECVCAHTRKYLSNVLATMSALEFLESIKAATPELWMRCATPRHATRHAMHTLTQRHTRAMPCRAVLRFALLCFAVLCCILCSVECYHYETRHRTVTTRNSDGSTSTRVETYQVRRAAHALRTLAHNRAHVGRLMHAQEKVVTHRERDTFAYSTWHDDSGRIIGLQQFRICKLRLSKIHTFGSSETAARFEAQAQAFRDRNRHRDTHMDYSQGLDIPGFKDHVLALVDVRNRPACLSLSWFWLWSLAGLTWPFRMWMESISSKRGFTVNKVIN